MASGQSELEAPSYLSRGPVQHLAAAVLTKAHLFLVPVSSLIIQSASQPLCMAHLLSVSLDAGT